jgi:N-hydroxyarylamine O-acetyltransferase
MDLYAFNLEPQQLPDYEMANYFVSTNPDSPFVRIMTVQLPTPRVRYILRGNELIEDRGSEIVRRLLSADDDRRTILAETFGLELPSGVEPPRE